MSAKEIVEFAITGDAVALKDKIFEVLQAKTKELIEAKRPEVAAEILGATVVTEEPAIVGEGSEESRIAGDKKRKDKKKDSDKQERKGKKFSDKEEF